MAVFEKFPDPRNGPSLAIPVALLSLAFLAAIGFQTVQSMRDHSDLANVYAGQENAVEQTLRLRNLVDGFAGEAATLAQEGNRPAKQLIETLRSQNITIRPSSVPPTNSPVQ